MKPVTLRADAEKPYRGTDDGVEHLTIEPGETAHVTPEKAEQLLADFPQLFTAPAPRATGEKPAAAGDAPKRTAAKQRRTTSR